MGVRMKILAETYRSGDPGIEEQFNRLTGRKGVKFLAALPLTFAGDGETFTQVAVIYETPGRGKIEDETDA